MLLDLILYISFLIIMMVKKLGSIFFYLEIYFSIHFDPKHLEKKNLKTLKNP